MFVGLKRSPGGTRMIGTLGYAAGLLMLASVAVQAAQPDLKLRMDTGFYLGAMVGRSEARDYCTLGGACDSKDTKASLFLGYSFNRNFAIEAAYVNLGEASNSGFVGGVATTIKTDTKLLELVGVGLLPLADSFALYVKAGLFRFDSEGAAAGALTAVSSERGNDFTVGVGAQYEFARDVAARVEWQRYFDIGSGIARGPKFDNNVLRVGARYKFF
jgi:OOP family OmpA-OmpF porin